VGGVAADVVFFPISSLSVWPVVALQVFSSLGVTCKNMDLDSDNDISNGALRASLVAPPYGIPNKRRIGCWGGAAAVHRPHGLEVEDKGHLKYFVVIFVFVEVLCIVRWFC
jgi:hypothetical protein